MTLPAPPATILHELDDPTRALVRLSALVTAGTEREVREAMVSAAEVIPTEWVEELLLQSYLFAGFPRTLNATREWRRVRPLPAATDPAAEDSDLERWRAQGTATCARVYGPMYDRLRTNIRGLHPLLDDWMITDGYGKVLSRSGLDLERRELCIVAACAAAGQERQLHSHLHGALNVGVAPVVVDQTLDALADLLGPDRTASARQLLVHVRGK